MEITRFAGAAWLLAQVLHTIFIVLITLIFSTERFGGEEAMFIAAGFLLSLPALAACVPMLRAIRSMRVAVAVKFLFWLLSIGLSLIAGHAVLSWVFFNNEVFLILLVCSIPGFVAAIVSSLLLLKSFGEATRTPEDEPDEWERPTEWEELKKNQQIF